MKKKILLLSLLLSMGLSLTLVSPANAGVWSSIKGWFSNIFKTEQKVGFSVVTDYQKTLRVSMTAAQDFVPVTSLTLKDSQVLDISMFGSKVFLTLEPGKDKEEIVMCTGINSSTLNFTGCTRGLAFAGTSTAAVAGLAKTHTAGSNVTISNVHYIYEEFVDKEKNQTVGGEKVWTSLNTFYTFPIVSSTGYTGLPTNDGDLATKYYVDTVGAGGFTSANVSTTRGLSVDGSTPEKVGINASSTTGMSFDGSGALYQKIQTSLIQDSNGIGVSTTSLSTGGVATSTPTAGMIPIASSSGYLDDWLSGYFGDGSNGDVTISATTTLTSDVYYENLTINSGVTLYTDGYKIYGKQTFTNNGTLTVSTSPTSGANGGNAAALSNGGAGAGGLGTTKRTLEGGTAGVAGGAGTSVAGGGNAGTAGIAKTCLGDAGAAGGAAGGGAGGSGGAGGAATTELLKLSYEFYSASTNTISSGTEKILTKVFVPFSTSNLSILSASAGSGGGGGAGTVNNAYGGGGGGGSGGTGGVILVAFSNIINNGNINANGANGGAGGNGWDKGHGGGGGGGGNGGNIILVYENFSNTGTVTSTGGLGGAGGAHGGSDGNNGSAGANGKAGKIYYIKL